MERPAVYPVDLLGASPQWWVKVIEMLQQNWALPVASNKGVDVLFVTDTSGVFDRLAFDSGETAKAALRRNGFVEYASDPGLQRFLAPPTLPLVQGSHPGGPIYSSGRFWLS
jgi:hypothetical protein